MDGRGGAQGAARAERAAARAPYLSLIDGVRGIAALAVLFYHYVHFFMAGPDRNRVAGYFELYPGVDLLWPAYQWGYYAVQVFWLISGFIFAHVYYGHANTARSFFINRLARLYPLHLLTLLVVAGLQLVALHRLGYTPIYGNFDWLHFAGQLFMAADWYRHGYSFNGPIWSVSVEIAVYVLFWLSLRPVARMGFPLVVALALGFGIADDRLGEFTRIFGCASFFFAGCALCLVHRSAWGQGWRLAFAATALAGAGYGATLIWGWWGWAHWGLTGMFGALFLLLAAWQSRAPAWLDRGCAWLGENTYGVYLWHFPIQLSLMLLLMPAIKTQDIAQNGWFLALFVALVIVVARVSYVWFERPMRDIVRRRLGSTPHLPKPAAKGGDKPVAVR